MGGGGDGGFGARQDAADAKKQAARNQLNVLFGVAPAAGSTINKDDFWKAGTGYVGGGSDGDSTGAGGGAYFDQAGYDAALAAEAAQSGDAAKNKADLEALFSTTRTNAYNAGKTRVDEQKTTADRNLKFELFARGLNGGSADIDQNALLGRTYSQGLTDLGAKADATATQLRSDNEQARLGLLQSIDSGMDSTSALSSALGQMKVNSDKAASDATGTALGDLFGNTALIYNQNRVALGKQNPLYYASSGSGTRSAGSSSGTLSNSY